MSKLRKSARGEDCTLQLFPYCNQNPETTVLCHLPSLDKGMAIKSPDYWSAYGCSNCHDVIDGRKKTGLSQLEVERCMWRGLFRTQKKMIEKGLMAVS